MELSDRLETVKVSLCVEDWVVVMQALTLANVPILERERINTRILDSARTTERILS